MSSNLRKITIRVHPEDIRTLERMCPNIPYNLVIRKILRATCERLIAADAKAGLGEAIPRSLGELEADVQSGS